MPIKKFSLKFTISKSDAPRAEQAQALSMLAQCYARAGKFENARASMERLKELKPADSQYALAACDLGDAALSARNWTLAADYFSAAL